MRWLVIGRGAEWRNDGLGLILEVDGRVLGAAADADDGVRARDVIQILDHLLREQI